MTAKAEIVSRDTVVYAGEYELEKVITHHETGEVSVRYYAHLLDMTNAKGVARKVTIDRKTFESAKITHLVYNVQDNGAKRISKAINKERK